MGVSRLGPLEAGLHTWEASALATFQRLTSVSGETPISRLNHCKPHFATSTPFYPTFKLVWY